MTRSVVDRAAVHNLHQSGRGNDLFEEPSIDGLALFHPAPRQNQPELDGRERTESRRGRQLFRRVVEATRRAKRSRANMLESITRSTRVDVHRIHGLTLPSFLAVCACTNEVQSVEPGQEEPIESDQQALGAWFLGGSQTGGVRAMVRCINVSRFNGGWQYGGTGAWPLSIESGGVNCFLTFEASSEHPIPVILWLA